MFYADECVRSKTYGLGVVLISGEKPMVRFLDEAKILVDGSTLQIVSDELFDVEVRNRFEIERWLTKRVTGDASLQPIPLAPPRVDLAERMIRSVEMHGLPRHEKIPSGDTYFIADELNT